MDELRLPPFDVTRAAIDQVEAVGGRVRVDVELGGCCGSTWTFDHDVGSDGEAPDDERFGCDGAELWVSTEALRMLTGARLDYGGALRPPRYRVLANPNTPRRCPCNRSFGAPWPGRGEPDCRAKEPMPWDT